MIGFGLHLLLRIRSDSLGNLLLDAFFNLGSGRLGLRLIFCSCGFFFGRWRSLALKSLLEAIIQASAQVFTLRLLFLRFLLLRDCLGCRFLNLCLSRLFDFLFLVSFLNESFKVLCSVISLDPSLTESQDTLSKLVNHGSLLLFFLDFGFGILNLSLLLRSLGSLSDSCCTILLSQLKSRLELNGLCKASNRKD